MHQQAISTSSELLLPTSSESPSIAEQPEEAEEIVKPTSKLGAYKLLISIGYYFVVVLGIFFC
jgi:hypothetical protein